MNPKQIKWGYLVVLSLIWGSLYFNQKRINRLNSYSGRFIGRIVFAAIFYC
jgi:hypothetical protein